MNNYYKLTIISLLFCQILMAKEVVVDTTGVRKAMIQSPAELLKGEVSGVRVSSTDGGVNGLYNVFIRGLNTVRGDSQPLWIVDGVVVGNAANQNLDAFFLEGQIQSSGVRLPDYSGFCHTNPVNNFGWLNNKEIESVEILKDLSSTARYGVLGANGVVIVNTRKASSGDRNINWSSDVGVNFLPKVGEAFRSSVSHNHNVGICGVIGNNANYNVSGFFRQITGAVKDSGSSTGGLTLSFETKASNVFHFGMNSMFAYGTSTSTGGVNYIGSPSTMTISRYPGAFLHDSVGGWLNDYDDDVVEYRTLNFVWLNINILPYLKLRLSAGADYQNQTRFLWFGEGTSFGARFDGAAATLNNSLMNYNTKGELSFFRNIAVKHRLEAVLEAELNGYMNKANSMAGTGFDLPYLRGKGISASKSNNAIRKFAGNNNSIGASAIVGYDFDGIAGFDATARMDYNPRFDKQPVWYPGANAYFNLGELVFPGGKAVSALKIAGGYGMAGREFVMPYQWMENYISAIPSIPAGTEYWHGGLNRLKSAEYTIGISAGFFEDRVEFSINYFDKRTDDSFLIYNTGKDMNGLWIDAHDMTIEQKRLSSLQNKGLEMDLDAQILDSDALRWFLSCNATCHLDNKIEWDALDFVEPSIKKGIYYYNDLNSTVPEYYAGLTSTWCFYGFTVDMKLSGAAGFDVINANKTLETWKNVITEACIEKGDFLRLDHIALSYEIPVRIRWIKELNVNLSAHNLFTLTGYSGWNPDVNCFGASVRSFGVDYGSFPLCRSLILGLNVKF